MYSTVVIPVPAMRRTPGAHNSGTASNVNNGAGAVDCDSRRAVGPVRTNYTRDMLDTTKPSGAFGGTFSAS